LFGCFKLAFIFSSIGGLLVSIWDTLFSTLVRLWFIDLASSSTLHLQMDMAGLITLVGTCQDMYFGLLNIYLELLIGTWTQKLDS